MQVTLTDAQITRLIALAGQPARSTDSNACHRAGMVSGALQLMQAQKADAAYAELCVDALEEAGETGRPVQPPRDHKFAVDSFLDALEMQGGIPAPATGEYGASVVSSPAYLEEQEQKNRRAKAIQDAAQMCDPIEPLLGQCLGGAQLKEAIEKERKNGSV